MTRPAILSTLRLEDKAHQIEIDSKPRTQPQQVEKEDQQIDEETITSFAKSQILSRGSGTAEEVDDEHD
jgi:hypothetical protein